LLPSWYLFGGKFLLKKKKKDHEDGVTTSRGDLDLFH
jgi:hypothetical protein